MPIFGAFRDFSRFWHNIFNPQFDAKLAPNDSQMHLKSCKTVRIVSWGLFRTLKNSKMAQIAKLLRWHQMMPFCRERPENGKGLSYFYALTLTGCRRTKNNHRKKKGSCKSFLLTFTTCSNGVQKIILLSN